MSRVLPSEVVTAIDQMFPWAAKQQERSQRSIEFKRGHTSVCLAAIVDLVREIPSELIVLQSAQYAELVASVAAIRIVLDTWKHDRNEILVSIPGFRDLNPVTLVRQALAACKDQYPSASTTDLKFVKSKALRENLQLDMSSSHKARSSGEWKAATVLAGSVIEALFLWRLERCKKTDIDLVVNKLKQQKDGLSPKLELRASNLGGWSLDSYIKVAAGLSLIGDEVTKLAHCVRGFRNLIHPGRERSAQPCDKGTAHIAVGVMELIARGFAR